MQQPIQAKRRTVSQEARQSTYHLLTVTLSLVAVPSASARRPFTRLRGNARTPSCKNPVDTLTATELPVDNDGREAVQRLTATLLTVLSRL